MSVVKALESENIGDEIYTLAREIFPICRSITGPGVRDTLAHLRRHVPIEVHEVPTGTQAFDWTVPKEWSIRDAYIKNAQGERVVDFRTCNLHVLNYSAPVSARLPLSERAETTAFSAVSMTGKSAAGSAWATLPPIVPRLRT